MKNLLFTAILAATCMTACQNEKVSEVDQKRQELETKKNELKEKQELAALDAEMDKVEREIEKAGGSGTGEAVSVKSKGAATRGRITGDNVIMRSAATVQSAKVDNFAKNETVTIYARAGASSTNEAVVTEDIQLYSYTGTGKTPMYILPKGKAVLLQEYIEQSDCYRVSYQHPEMGKLEAVVKTSQLDNILNQTWFQVRRANGQTGWVLGKFLVEL